MQNVIYQSTTGFIQFEICNSFWKRFKGLMFRKDLPSNYGLLFPSTHEDILNAAIHMLFMNFPIAVIWINKENRIVDKVIAKPWHLYYAPKSPASCILETHPHYINEFILGEKFSLNDEK